MSGRTPLRFGMDSHQAKCTTHEESLTMHKTKLTKDEVGHLVSRLTRANTAKAMKCRTFSVDRLDYEKRCEENSVLKNRDSAETERKKPKRIPDSSKQADEDELKAIVKNVNRETHCSHVRNTKNANEHQGCQKCGEKPKNYDVWQPKKKSSKEREELTRRLLEGNFVHATRKRDAQFKRSNEKVYFIQLLENAPNPTGRFVRGGMKYKLED